MEFLKQEIDSEEQRNLVKVGFGTEKRKNVSTKAKTHSDDDFPTAAGLFNGESGKSSCIFCDKQHVSEKCFTAQVMTLEDKKAKIQNKRACYNCFKPGHQSKKCRTAIKCIICGKKHQVLLCPEHSSNKRSPPRTLVQENSQTTLSSLNCTSEVVLQTLMVRVRNENGGRGKLVRALIDNGSQRSYILKKTAEGLGLQTSETVTLNQSLFGGSQVTGKIHNIFKVGLQSIQSNYSKIMKVLDQTQICENIPRVAKGPWLSQLREKGIRVTDLDNDTPSEIKLLIGADNVGCLLTGNLIQLSNGLTATETQLGWTLMGRHGSKESTVAMNVISMIITSATVSELWNLETIGIHDPVESVSRQERELAAKHDFMKTVSRNEEGRYSVCLPWILGMENIPSNKLMAEKRLTSTTNKLNGLNKYEDYDEIFKAWQKEGIISECSIPNSGSSGESHYLPHRAVLKPESKTTPIRPVFDASCKVGRSPSLNDCLEKGPNLSELLPSILLRFRVGKIGVISDIRKAFLMIEVNEMDRNFMRFLWWEDLEKKSLKIYRHNRVVFGMNCSPFLLGAVIEYHLNSVVYERKQIAQKLLKCLYVDNCVSSVNTTEEFDEFKKKSVELLAEAKMELREWEWSGDNSVDRVTSVLGLKWDKFEDSLSCEKISGGILLKITKRIILSQLQKIFDPLGFLCPITLLLKLILQRLWSEKGCWDEKVTVDYVMEFEKWWTELSQVLEKIQIPRNCTGGQELIENYQIHTFSDASKSVYAAVVFLCVQSVGGVSIQLLQAKSRVAPLKIATIPRLELLSCTIAARLTSTVKEALSLTEVPTHFWNDSTTALTWIKRNDDWGTFVGNRVREICSLTNEDSWRHVPGALNPADLPSRGCTPLKLMESRWWEGPEWLKSDSSKWPAAEMSVDEALVNQEKRKGLVASMANFSESGWWVTKHSSFVRNVRIVAMVLRYIDKLRKKSSEWNIYPTQAEIDKAELRIFKLIQAEVFPVGNKVVSGLRVVVDEGGIIRVKTKLIHRQDSIGFRYPVLLPTSHPMVEKLIREQHIYNSHASTQFLVGKLRETCWIIQSRRAVKKIVKSCVTCRRYTTKIPNVPPAALPEVRVNEVKAFEITGVDLAGPLVLKDKSKCYIVLFTCANYRCVHLELVQSLSTDDFLLALIRFCKRKRRPRIIYSDNRTNFVGSSNLFKTIDWKEVESRTRQKRIEWRFNPPSAPWWGGWWERLIRSVKDLLKRMLGFSKLTYVQMETCLCEVECVINGRPLTYVTEDQDDLIPLTPSMFIHNLPESECPEAKLLQIDTLQNKYQDLKQLLDELGSRFRKEYLSQLVQRGKENNCHEFRVGDVVLVGSDDKKRVQWNMARILELFPGKDGICRVARVKTATGELTRPLQRLFPLEVTISQIIPPVTETVIPRSTPNPVIQTRSGRRVKPPMKYGSW